MNVISHKSSTASHYDKIAEHYDIFNETRSRATNHYLGKLLKSYNIQTVLDLTCGTGSQVLYLHNLGFGVVGSDINTKMLEIARNKADGLNIELISGDVRKSYIGKFDAVITIFNAIGHLTKGDFEKAISNIYANLKHGGLYIFDIFNLSYMLNGDNITKFTIDWMEKFDDVTAREIQYSTISEDGIMASYDIYHNQRKNELPKITTGFQTLQIYDRMELRNILAKHNFRVIKQCNINGGRFYEKRTQRILTIAKR